MGHYGTFNYGSGVHYGDGQGAVVPAWTPLGGGNHLGKDWIITKDTVVAGVHYNIGHFEVVDGVVAIIKEYDGAAYGGFEVLCKSARVLGSISGSLSGHPGGPGGGGGGGAGSVSAGVGGLGGVAPVGPDGEAGQDGAVGASALGGEGGDGAAGTGAYGGNLGAGGASGGGDGGSATDGGYAVAGGQGDVSTDESLNMGSGGGGGGGGGGQNTVPSTITAGGGGAGGSSGGSGGAIVKIEAIGGIIVSGKIFSHGGFSVGGKDGKDAIQGGSCILGYPVGRKGGDGGAGGSPTDTDALPGVGGESLPIGADPGGDAGVGGDGAGGGILLKTAGPIGLVITGAVKTLGGMTEVGTGGTYKKFYAEGEDHTTGTEEAGRIYPNSSLTQGHLV